MKRMTWEKLLSTKRVGKRASSHDDLGVRSEFTRDFDRIIFSSAFRRLQDKTQLFPLTRGDYVRTRLTHSLETASVGRSLGILAADVILEKEENLKEVLSFDIGTIVATACLAHDIGNPPFGHAGESAIREWFNSIKECDSLRKSKYFNDKDFSLFEGNAFGLRTLCSLQNDHLLGGLQLTYAVIGAFTKYPCSSNDVDTELKDIALKKFGYMESEKTLFSEVANELGLVRKNEATAWCRHPLAFLVEAADDICYNIMDIEDGFKTGCVTFKELHELHKPWIPYDKILKADAIFDEQKRAEYYRAITINKLIGEVIEAFRRNYEDIMRGKFKNELLEKIDQSNKFLKFKELAREKVYTNRAVLKIEASGFEVLGWLLDVYWNAIKQARASNSKKPVGKEDRKNGINALPPGKVKTMLGLLPEINEDFYKKNQYECMLVAVDYVAGMTDSFALELYQQMRGISL